MEYEDLTSVLSILVPIGFALGILFLLIRWIRLEILTYRNQRAAVQTSPAVACSKDPDVDFLPQGFAGSSVHHITFHTDSGDIVTLYMGFRDYYAIEEGARGILTWQGTRFWSFVQE